MAGLTNQVSVALNENRILILGGQVLLGFELHSVFGDRWFEFDPLARALKTASLTGLLVGIGLMFVPSAYHRLAARGQSSRDVLDVASTFTALALVPFAFSLTSDVFLVFHDVFGRTWGLLAGGLALVVAVFFWYGLGFGRRKAPRPRRDNLVSEDPPLAAKIDLVLTEARLVLPGAQALLGFQLAVTVTKRFGELPWTLKALHAASLGLVAISVILLIAPAAFHRIAEHGETRDSVYRFASLMISTALVPLGLGMCGDFYMVLRVVGATPTVAGGAALAMLLLYGGLWFVFPLSRRRASMRSHGPVPDDAGGRAHA